ncbi:MAG: hypothetical protein WCW13_05025 [archaeon]|jgi:hypothetical protein
MSLARRRVSAQRLFSSPLTRRYKNIRRAFRSFSTEEAWTFVVSSKGKRRFCRVHRIRSSKPLATQQKLVLDLFHKLYPNNSLTPVGLIRIPGKVIRASYPEEFEAYTYVQDGSLRDFLNRGLKRRERGLYKFPIWGVVSEIERRQSPDFKVYQREVRGGVANFSKAAKRHIAFMKSVAYPLANKILKESGIRVDYTGNISNVRGNPLFFEPKITAPTKLIALIKTKPSKERKGLMQIARNLNLV